MVKNHKKKVEQIGVGKIICYFYTINPTFFTAEYFETHADVNAVPRAWVQADVSRFSRLLQVMFCDGRPVLVSVKQLKTKNRCKLELLG